MYNNLSFLLLPYYFDVSLPKIKAIVLIIYIHDRVVRIIYQDYTLSFTDILTKDKFLTNLHKNLQNFKIFKVKIGIAPKLMGSIYQTEDNPYKPLKATIYRICKLWYV